MPLGVTISKNGHLYVIKKNGREITYAHSKEEAKRKQKKVREGTL